MRTAPVVVVGAGLGGWRTVVELRRLGMSRRIVLCGDEGRDPYDRPPLSKQFLRGEVDVESLALGRMDDQALDLSLRGPAVAVGPGWVELESGERLEAGDVVVATGARARELNMTGRADLLVLRSVHDAIRLRATLATVERIAVVGGGFVGAEVASAARRAGVEVVLLEQQDEMFAASLGTECGRRMRELHEADAVQVRLAVSLESVEGPSGKPVLRLSDSSTVTADAIVVGIGAVPRDSVLPGRLDGSVGSGIACDADGAVEDLDGVHAVGDVARWFDPVAGRHVRREHWSSAQDQAAIVAHRICGLPVPEALRSVPYFWSDQAGTKVQVLGRPELAERHVWRPVPDHPERTVLEYWRGPTLVAAAAVGASRLVGRLRKEVAAAEKDLRIKEKE